MAGIKNGRLSVVALGGLGEIGKNMTVIQYEQSILVVDAGLAFPDEDMLGVDIVIPDVSYLLENQEKVQAIVLTHGHEDHIGALPFILKDLRVPVYGTKLTLGLLEDKLREHEGVKMDGRIVRPRERVRAGPFDIEFFRVNHSIADCVGLGIRTPRGLIVHTGDFKFDQTPVDDQVADFHKLAEYGDAGTLLLLSDSTNAERPGYTPSERAVGQKFDRIFGSSRGRILVASFASHTHRIQQALVSAKNHGRKCTVIGRSMENAVSVAMENGYLEVPEDTLVTLEQLARLPDDQVVILTTGSQGEPMSALTRISQNDHRRVEIRPGDTVIVAATPVPGNEKLVHRTIDNLFRRGADVIYGTDSGVHVSGHGSIEELKLMYNLTRPKFFMPIHGEYRHLVHHARLANDLGLSADNILVGENGHVFEFTGDGVVRAARAQSGNVLVDGTSVGDVGNAVLRERRQIALDGMVVIVLSVDKESGDLLSGPEVTSRGFVYVKEADELMESVRQATLTALDRCKERQIRDWAGMKGQIRDHVFRLIYERIRRKPVVLPFIQEI
jgi:ribonuclease J